MPPRSTCTSAARSAPVSSTIARARTRVWIPRLAANVFAYRPPSGSAMIWSGMSCGAPPASRERAV